MAVEQPQMLLMKLKSIILTFMLAIILHPQLSAVVGGASVSPQKCQVWGPGLKTDFVVPVRYLMIQAVDIRGENITESIGSDAFSVQISEQGSQMRTRVWVQVMDRNDGSYLARFKLFAAYENLQIEVKFGGQHVAESPYKLTGPAYHEKCNCPNPSLEDWMDRMECPSRGYKQIKQDLSIFKEVDMEKVAKEAIERFNKRGSHALCHYVVKDNKIYRRTFGEHVGFKMFMDAILLSMSRKVHLPDIELFVNLGDWPLEKRKVNEGPLPIFSWCGSDDTRDIIMPTYDVTESTLETMGRCDNVSVSLEMPTYQISEEKLKNSCRVTLDLISVQANTGPRWHNKSSLAFWRGRDSRQERLDLVRMSRKMPDILDAKLTNMFFFKHQEDLGEIVKHISFFDFFKYKYQVSIDGTVAAYRFPYLLAGDSVVLKQDSPYYEHFYKQLKPYEHYIPFKRDLSDLLEKIQWAKDHDEEAEQIGRNAQQFVRDNLMSKDIFCYHALLFKAYAKKLVKSPEVKDDMELVPQPDDHESKCNCQTHRKLRDEL